MFWFGRRASFVLTVSFLICLGSIAGCGSGTTPAGSNTPSQAAPNLSSLSQASANAGAAAFSLSVTGQNFLSASVVEWNGAPLPTTFTSATQLVASVPAANLAIAGTAQIAVEDPAPQSLISNTLTFSINSVVPPAPVLTTLSSASAIVGSASFALTVTGQNFISSSVVQLNGVSLTTVMTSATQLVATVPAASLTSTGPLPVTVVDPSPLSLVSNALTFTVNPIPPNVTSVNPSSAIVNTGPVTVVLSGQNFATGATASLGSTKLTITAQTTTQIQTSIPASLLTATGMFPITVSNPAPNAATSMPVTFTVNPVPVAAISSINPTSVTAGATAVNLQVTGQAFVSGATIQLNGTAIATNYQSSTSLSAVVPDASVAAAGTVAVTILSPGTGSGPVTSNSVNLTVNPLPAGEFIVNQVANDIVWDPQHKLIYASVPNSAAQNPNSIVAIDPTTGLITKSVFAGSGPDLLAISDDGQFLYAALDGSSNVQRFILPALTPDILVSLGGSNFYGLNTAIALDVAPGAPHTWEVSIGNPGTSPEAIEGVTVFDDAVARPTSAGRYTSHPNAGDLLLGTAVWGKDTTVIYGANNESTGFDFYVLPVTSVGIPGTTILDYPSAVSGFGGRIHFDRTTNYVYADNGPVLDPSTGKSVGTFSTSGVMVPDGSIGKAFFSTPLYTSSSPLGTITSYDINHFTPINSILFPNVVGGTGRLIRWGNNGLAFNANNTNYTGTTTTTTGKVYIYSGTFVQ
jgi:hypothetical protein